MPIDPDTGLDNWDCPESFDSIKMHQSLQYTRANHGQLPHDHPKGEDSNTHDGSMTVSNEFLDELRRMIPDEVDSTFRLVIVDGILLFWDTLIYKEFDSSIFIHAGKETLKQRREARQGYVTQEGINVWLGWNYCSVWLMFVKGYWVDPPGYFDQLVWPQYVKWNSHLFPDGKHKELSHSSIQDLLVMNSDTESIEDIATRAMKALITQLQAKK
jgi:nicotinamide/nicotinate riboside kinase